MKILFYDTKEVGCLYAARLKEPSRDISSLVLEMVHQTKKETVI
jgi:hypothetical protein